MRKPTRDDLPSLTRRPHPQNRIRGTRTTRSFTCSIDGGLELFDFNPATLAVHARGPLDVSWIGEPQFSYSQPNMLYGIPRGQLVFQQYDISTSRTTNLHDAL